VSLLWKETNIIVKRDHDAAKTPVFKDAFNSKNRWPTKLTSL
jgi:hypothetical protein